MSADSIRDAAALRGQILARTAEYHALAFSEPVFFPGETPVLVSGKIFGTPELTNLVDSSLDFWLTTGRYAESFKRDSPRCVASVTRSRATAGRHPTCSHSRRSHDRRWVTSVCGRATR